MKKRALLRICAFACVLALIGAFLTSCGGTETGGADYDNVLDMQKPDGYDARVQSSYISRSIDVQDEIGAVYFPDLALLNRDALASTMGERTETNEKMTLYGETYTVNAKLLYQTADKNDTQALSCTDSDGNKVGFHIDSVTQEVLRYSEKTVSENGGVDYIGFEAAQEAAEDFVSEVVNGRFGLDISLSDYELRKASDSSRGYEFLWYRFYNGIMIHSFSVKLTPSGTPWEFTSAPLPDSDAIALLDDFSLKDARDFAAYNMAQSFERAAEKPARVFVSFDYRAYDDNLPRLMYIRAIDKYVIELYTTAYANYIYSNKDAVSVSGTYYIDPRS